MAGRWVDLREAAQELGTSTEAVRKRAARGTLESRKGEDGKVYVRVDTDRPDVHPQDQGEGSELVEELRDRVRSLERMLEAEREARTEERRRHDTLMARLMDRIPELEHGEPPGESQGAQESRTEAPDPTPTPPHEEAQGEPQRPWWRRIFGS